MWHRCFLQTNLERILRCLYARDAYSEPRAREYLISLGRFVTRREVLSLEQVHLVLRSRGYRAETSADRAIPRCSVPFPGLCTSAATRGNWDLSDERMLARGIALIAEFLQRVALHRCRVAYVSYLSLPRPISSPEPASSTLHLEWMRVKVLRSRRIARAVTAAMQIGLRYARNPWMHTSSGLVFPSRVLF
jgi:hypothetical protein